MVEERRPQVLRIPHLLPSLNDLLRWKGKGRRGNLEYNRIKQEIEREIYYLCTEQGIVWVPRAWFRFTWVERSRRRDMDNISSAGRKFILDGLVSARRLSGDGWKYVIGWEDVFRVDSQDERIEVQIYDQLEQYGQKKEA